MMEGNKCIKQVISKTFGCQTIIVSPEDSYLLENHIWGLIRGRNTYYAATHIRQTDGSYKTIKLHTIIMKNDLSINPGYYVDHINGNGLDNRRGNLRVVTPAVNNRNTKTFDTNSSGVSGVKFDDHTGYGNWVAQISENGVRRNKGFAVNKYGYNEAKEMAIKQRKEWEKELGYISR